MKDPEVSGSGDSLKADGLDLLHEARLLRSAGHDLADLAVELHRVLVDPDLLASVPLHPGGLPQVEGHLLAALDGPHGLTRLALELEARSLGLGLAAATYARADRALAVLAQLGTWASDEAADLLRDPWPPHNPLDELQELLTDNTALVEELVGASPALLTALQAALPGPDVPIRSVPDAAALLGLLFRDGTGSSHLVDTKEDMQPPPTVRALLDDLDAAGERSTRTAPTIAVRRVAHPPGQPVWVVDLPGTSEWDLPLDVHGNPADTAGNLHAMAGDRTAYQQAVRDALAQAHVPHDQAVMLVGHSQGGMVAVQTAGGMVADGYHVTHVLTAGSPVGGMRTPPGVHVLSLENRADVVPALDGRDNPVTPERTTVLFTEDTGTVSGNHGVLSGYGNAATWVDTSPDPDVKAWRDSAQPFLSGTTMTTSTYAVTRP